MDKTNFLRICTLFASIILGIIAYMPYRFGKPDAMFLILYSPFLAIGILCFWFTLRGNIEKDRKLIKGSLKSGFTIGFISFIVGYIGPIIFKPSANQGPLLGIFITGPVGFVIGTLVGIPYSRWNSYKKEKNIRNRKDGPTFKTPKKNSPEEWIKKIMNGFEKIKGNKKDTTI